MLEIRNLSKIYSNGKNKVTALDNISLNFGSKGLVVILGKSGCGKSTLINMVGGLDLPTSGEIVINGRSSATFSKTELDLYRNTYVGVVFQEFNLIDEISVFENIDMTMKLQEKNADLNTVDEALSMVGLSNLGYRKPSELSGGQRQRVALARALLKKPEIILADEPTGSLDTATGEGVFESLKKIAQDKLVIVVTHDKELAYTYGERIVEIADGRIVGDKTRQDSDRRDIKELSDGVIEVASPSKISADVINKRLKKDKVNYIGLSYDKDRIALAYSETVDSFYERADAHRFETTAQESIKKDDKDFRLSKGKMPLKEAIKMSRANIKRAKKRFVLLTVLTSFCFTFLIIAIIASSVNLAALVARGAFGKHSQGVIAVTNTQKNEWGNITEKPLEQRDIDNIISTLGTSGYARYANAEFAPSYAMSGKRNYSGHGYEYTYEFSCFTGVMEGAPSDLGISLVAGSKERCDDPYELIISDMAAFELMRSGYMGYDNQGKSGIFYPESFAELIGAKVKMGPAGYYVNSGNADQVFYTIAGIFVTDYEDYKSLMTASPIDSGSQKLLIAFGENNAFLYSKAFVSPDFMKHSNFGGSTYINISYPGYGMFGGGYSAEEYEYSRQKVYNSHGEDLFWSKTADQKLPETLKRGEVIISYNTATMLISDGMGIADRDVLTNPKFLELVSQPFVVNMLSYDKFTDSQISTTKSYTIVGVLSNKEYDYYNMSYFNKDDVMDFVAGTRYTTIYTGKTSNQYGLQGKIAKLLKDGYYTGNASVSAVALAEIESAIKTIGKVFLYISLGFAVFAFLIIYNYMASSVKFRTKEIAVYRIIGARPRDIAKIFLAEGGLITIRITIIVSILAWLICMLINSILSSIISYMGISVSLISFAFFHPLIVLGLVAAFFVISSLVPISRITRKTPVEALKLL